MTVVTGATTPAARRSRASLSTLTVSAAGAVALLARPWMTGLVNDPTVLLATLFVALAVVGACWPLPVGGATDGSAAAASAKLPPAVVIGLGVAAFGVASVVAGAPPTGPLAGQVVALHTLAAVAEEAFFRRLVYGALLPHGEPVALVGSAVAFAAVHVTVWGLWVLPLDIAAGLILSWQRWASGGWSAPALTHVAANLAAVA